MTERWPSARKYRDIFEQVKSSVMDLIAEGRHQPRKTIDILDIDMMESFGSLDDKQTRGLGDYFSQMIAQMTGQNMEWNSQQVFQSAKTANAAGPMIFPQSNFYEDMGAGNFPEGWFPPTGFDLNLAYNAVENDFPL
jgi:hypothetical protein